MRHYVSIYMQGLRRTTNISVRTNCLHSEIWSRGLQNRKLDWLLCWSADPVF